MALDTTDRIASAIEERDIKIAQMRRAFETEHKAVQVIWNLVDPPPPQGADRTITTGDVVRLVEKLCEDVSRYAALCPPPDAATGDLRIELLKIRARMSRVNQQSANVEGYFTDRIRSGDRLDPATGKITNKGGSGAA